ncbi:MarR family winged helix-turn-helix transcriptional regulator [Piscinibacter sakaiensis]|uniref:Transcriptional regulator, MarR family n=1 Tax=Piscinibacter sakaiensis TaxID=1547922 RepID=A0A0K8P351_PISS1|nr:MarR family winged helix-turn-helix transcriptional regulator [Piscinibacter sakaiensis]GAP36605.1 transcriptional regulator, MarR family [Piscinibacter sakaiensis]
MSPPSTATERPRGCTHLKLRQLARRVGRHYDHCLGQSGLKTTQYSLLSHVDRLGPVRPGALAAALRMEPSTLTRNLRPLQAAGWVALQPGDDARSRHVVLTAAGRAKRAEAQAHWKRAQLALNARLGEDRVAVLHALIDDWLAVLGPDEGEEEDGGHVARSQGDAA